MKKYLIALFVIAIIVATWYSVSVLLKKETVTPLERLTGEQVRIGFSLGTLQEERWQKDVDYFSERARELGAVVDVKYSGEDGAVQISHAENFIAQGVDTLVIVPFDATTAATIVEKAHAAGVKVIAYDRMILKSPVDLYITFDSRRVGELQAEEILKNVSKGAFAYIGGAQTDNNAFLLKEGSMKVLQPYIDRGDITLVVDAFSPNWHPEEAYRTLKQYLSTGKTVDAVVAANDGTGGGSVQALSEFGLEGKVPVSGQDADLAACQRIAAGTQTMTVYKPLRDLAYTAAEAAVALSNKKEFKTNGVLNNGLIDVPSYFLDPVIVTKDTMEHFLETYGFHTHEEVYGAR